MWTPLFPWLWKSPKLPLSSPGTESTASIGTTGAESTTTPPEYVRETLRQLRKAVIALEYIGEHDLSWLPNRLKLNYYQTRFQARRTFDKIEAHVHDIERGEAWELESKHEDLV